MNGTSLELPSRLSIESEKWWQNYHEGGGLVAKAELDRHHWQDVIYASKFCSEHILKHIQWFDSVWMDGGFDKPLDLAVFKSALRQELAESNDETRLGSTIRQWRNRGQCVLAWRDLAGLAPDAETLRALSDLAELMIGATLDRLIELWRPRYGLPLDEAGEEQSLVVVAMGKLGGRELNFSSDVDLVFAYSAGGKTDGARSLENGLYFLRLAQRATTLLEQCTEEGFVYRVDTRLRPFGDSGALVVSFTAMEQYFQQHGRTWERYAWIKARTIHGHDRHRLLLMHTIRSFVYRRYTDFTVIEALRVMKEKIGREVILKELEQDIKRGPGGIREAEFIVQTFQLLHGGRCKDLRHTGFVAALTAIMHRGDLEEATALRLRDNYLWLRKLENRLQMYADQSIQRLPNDDERRCALAWSMNHIDKTTFECQCRQVRDEVHALFSDILAPGSGGSATEPHVLEKIVHEDHPGVQINHQLASMVMDVFSRMQSQVMRFQRPDSAHRLEMLLPLLLDAAGRTDHPLQAAQRMALVIESIARRGAYLSLLLESPSARQILAQLCTASPWIAEHLAAFPILLDDLLDERMLLVQINKEALRKELNENICQTTDLEEKIELLRRFRNSIMLRIATAEITGHLPIMKVSDYLTDLAEVVLAEALVIAWDVAVSRYGIPVGPSPECTPRHLCLVAYGKLGGYEMNYASDLDLIFLHDCQEQNEWTTGNRSIENEVFFTRLVQSLVHMLAVRTTSGLAYEIDTRLRPSGKSGLLVSSLGGFARYQMKEAWIWEHQALVRSRPVVGPTALCDRFEQIRRTVLSLPRDSANLAESIGDMRKRMLDVRAGSVDQFCLKTSPGGMIDIEFLSQYAVLRWARKFPTLMDYTDNVRILDVVAQNVLEPAEDCVKLKEYYLLFRQRWHELTLQGKPDIVKPDEYSSQSAEILRIRQRWLGG